jgi:hypothetical protein
MTVKRYEIYDKGDYDPEDVPGLEEHPDGTLLLRAEVLEEIDDIIKSGGGLGDNVAFSWRCEDASHCSICAAKRMRGLLLDDPKPGLVR